MTNPMKMDPTHTVSLRRQFMTDMRKRYRRYERIIKTSVSSQPHLDEKFYSEFPAWAHYQAEKVFHQKDLTGVLWTHNYIRRAYESGAGKAYSSLKKEDLSEDILVYHGEKTQFLRTLMGSAGLLLPVVRNARHGLFSSLAVLLERVAYEVKSLSNTLVQKISRVLSTETLKGGDPKSTAALMSEEINKQVKPRAMMLIHNEVIRTHAEAQLDAYDVLGAESLTLVAEWVTSGLDNVCPRCQEKAGQEFTIEEARGLIPLHPLCMCSWSIRSVE